MSTDILFDSEGSDLLRHLRESGSLRDVLREQERKWDADRRELLKSIVPYLADCGWYFYMYLPADEPVKLKQLLDEQAHEKIEQHMIALAKEYASDVRVRIQRDWPHRAKILNDAFDAHDGGLYSLSIPTMLAQADGICMEIVEASLFKTGGKKRLKDKLANLLKYGNSTNVLFEFLYRETALGEGTSARDAKRKSDAQHGALNRHGVLHGLDLDYATESNSFRAIVILGYLQHIQMVVEVTKKVKQEIEEVCKGSGLSW